MEMRNASSAGENYNSYSQLFCSAKDLAGLHKELITLSVFNATLAFIAFMGNALILFALHKETSLHSPTKLLLRNLSLSDLLVGVISEPLVVVYWMSVVFKQWSICHFTLGSTFISTYILGPVSLLTLTSISVDRLLALTLGLRYRQVVTLKRTWVVIISFWVLSSIAATMYLWDYHIPLWYGNIVTPLCLVTSIFSYTKIYLKLRHHRVQVQGHINQGAHLNIERHKKAVSSAMWLQFTVVLCYLPAGLVGELWANSKFSSSLYLARQCASTLVFLNSSLNPLLYCWKIKEVRQAVKDTIRQLFSSSS